jgi:hypothetical protein
LFANCLVALDARTGKRLWHFQEIAHDIWDLDIPAPPNLATITRDGRRVDAVTAVTKIGNTLLLDRVTGKPIFPFRLRRAPTSTVPGEETWPYQPDPELPERFSTQEFKREDLTDRSEEATEWAVSQFVSATTGFSSLARKVGQTCSSESTAAGNGQGRVSTRKREGSTSARIIWAGSFHCSAMVTRLSIQVYPELTGRKSTS